MPTVGFKMVRKRRVFVNHPVVKRELAKALDGEVKPHFLKIFNGIVAPWTTPVTFKARKFISSDSIRVNVFPTGSGKEIYTYVTKGTRPHKIIAKNAPALRFRTNYASRTRPGSISSNGPGKATGPWRATISVDHPGNEARNFEGQVLDQEQTYFSRTVENAFRRGIRKMKRG